MVFRGLASNDASAEQYQLWIFDRNQSDAHPIDGGVFDVPAGVDEVIVPIDAKIDVSEAWQFAVTVEQPGGVVVSDRSRLPLLATTQG
jgi:anti-sigma-K factor RskA